MSLKLKNIIAEKFPNIVLAVNFYSDFKQYRKWNYSSKGLTFEKSQGKIYRQTHVIEKGMSLSHPRKDFGIAKINELLKFLDEYLQAGYSVETTVFQNAIYVLQKYIVFQKKLGKSNYINELESRLKKYNLPENIDYNCGICHETKEHLREECNRSFSELVKSRHSIRQFSDEELDYSLIKKAVETAMKSPSECNRQSVKVYVFKQASVKKKLDKFINGNTGFAEEVKNYLIIASDISSYTSAYERNQMYVDGALFAMTLMLSLHELGIGSCALQHSETREKNDNLRKIISLPPNERVIMFLAVGHYKDEFYYAVSKRKELEEVYFEI